MTTRYAEDHSDDSDYARHMRRPQRGQSPERDRDRDREYRRPSQRRYNGQEESDSDEEEYRRPTRRKPPPGDRDSEIRNSRGGSVRNSGERAASSFTPKALSSTTSTPSAAWVDSRKDNWVEKENSRPVPTQSWTSASRSMERDRGDDRGLTRDRRGSGRESDRDYEIDREHVRRSRDGGYRSRRDQYSDDESPYTDSTSPDMLTLPPRGQREPGGRDSTSRSKGSDSGDRGGDAVEEYQERDRRRGGSRGHDGGDVGRRRENSRSRERHNDRLFEDGGRFTREDNMTKSRDRSHSKGGDDWRDDGNEDQSLVGSRRESFGDRSKNSDYREEVYKHALTTYGSQSAMTTADPIERRGSATSMTSTPNTADEDESQESERGRDYIKDTTSYSASSATKGGAAFIMYSPASGGSTDLVQCLIVRERTGMGSSMYPSYKLFLEDKNKLLLIGRKMNFNSTSNYHIFDMTRGTASKKLTKKSGNYLGKLRAADSNRTEYALVTRSEVREEVAAIVFDRVGLVSQIKDGCQPRKMSVLLPQLDAESHPVPHRTENKHGVKKSMVDMLKRDDTSRMFLLASKEPVYENGNYRLNFHGRVSVPSVKNFQLSSPDDPGHVICQFGKIGDDRFHLDYKAPLNAFQAFSLALCHFDA